MTLNWKTNVVADGKHFAPTELRIVWIDNHYKYFATLSLDIRNYN
jgi:hypothetical protein